MTQMICGEKKKKTRSPAFSLGTYFHLQKYATQVRNSQSERRRVLVLSIMHTLLMSLSCSLLGYNQFPTPQPVVTA